MAKNQNSTGGQGEENVKEAGAAGSHGLTGDDDGTGTPDSTYALISTAYHLLQGADTMTMFIEDADEEGDDEVSEFLEETREMFIERAEEAKRLLATCLTGEGEEEEEEEE